MEQTSTRAEHGGVSIDIGEELPLLSVESIDLQSLIHHSHSVANDMMLEDLERCFREHEVEYLVLVREGRVTGICSHRRLGRLMSARFGFALNSRRPAWTVQVDRPVVLERHSRLRTVLACAMARCGESFHEDVALVDENHQLIGLIPAARLAHVQTQLVAEQLYSMRQQFDQQRRLEQRMKQREKHQLFETLVAGIAHELNNKLTPVLGFSELLPTIDHAETRNQYLSLMGKSVAEAASIIRQLLQLSRPESGQRCVTDLRELVTESLIMLKFQARDAGVEMCRRLPELAVRACIDPVQIKQVLINLVINAVHATEGFQNPRVEIAAAEKHGCAVLEVRDNGVGIDPAIAARIFDPFFTTKGPDKGSGLGLSVCLSIVRRHGGSVAVESSPGKGACFTVTLPLAAAEPKLARCTPSIPVPRAPLSSPLPIKRVLIADDEDAVRSLMREVLTRNCDCQVDLASNGAMALEMARQGGYDLILSDFRMPQLDGADLFRALVKTKPEYERRFVIITGHAGERELEGLCANWIVPVLRKPFSPESLVSLCRTLLLDSCLAA